MVLLKDNMDGGAASDREVVGVALAPPTTKGNTDRSPIVSRRLQTYCRISGGFFKKYIFFIH